VGEREEQIGRPEGKLTDVQVDLLVRRLDGLPTLPAVAARLGELSSAIRDGEGASVDSIVGLIESDVSLTARMLSLASAAGAGSVQTVAQAVARLGAEPACSAALSAGIVPAVGLDAQGDSGFDYPAFWRHCLAVATAAEMLAENSALPIEPSLAFVCGLLHDMGKLALEQLVPKSYKRVIEAATRYDGNIADYERKILCVDHSTLGRRLAEHWYLPPAVGEVAWLHHQPFEAIPATASHRLLAAVVGLADAIARRRRIGFSGNFSFPRSPQQLAGPLGISEQLVEEVSRSLPERIEQRSDRLALVPLTSDALYREALANAHAELGRMNEQLRLRAEQLTTQARAYELLGEFFLSLRPEAVVADVLPRIAMLMGQAHGTDGSPGEPIIAYSVGEQNEGVLAVILDGSADHAWRTLQRAKDFDERRGATPPADVAEAVSAVLADIDDLLEAVNPAGYIHRPLLAAGMWVGGVLLPGKPLPGQLDGRAESLCDALAGAVALALSIVQGRCKAMQLSEQLAGASQVLADTQEALAQAKMLAALGGMAAGAAHELNTPLAVISGRAQLMREQASGKDEVKTWDLIADQAHRISDILTELMAYASPPAPAPAKVQVDAILKDAVKAFSSSKQPQAASASVDISIEEDVPAVWADRRQLLAVLEELIANAVTACKKAPRIRLQAEADEMDEMVLFSVMDNGPGIDEETLSHVFTPFFSSHQAGRQRGLGLPRAKRLVEINRGRMWIRSRPGEGTTVYFQIPQYAGGQADQEN